MFFEKIFFKEIKAPLYICFSAIGIFIGVFISWSYLAPTSGAVISSGEIRPNGSNKFEIIAQLNPLDIDQVDIGSSVRLIFSSYNFKQQKPIERYIYFISESTEFNPLTNQSYFIIKISLELEKFKKQNPNIKLRSGLPVEIFIKTQKRTLFDYLMDSIINLKEKGMRE
ncbi:hypothetical protein [Marinomonas sp. PE14-40]|uniref:hypothetical protein n=1 Tax=Marinomonas sp. PE14-40 TaxID=3060621 RepID=UPI003F664F6F